MDIDIKKLLEEVDSLKERWFIELENILLNCLNPKHFYGISHDFHPAFRAFIDVVNAYSLKPITSENFRERYDAFRHESQENKDAAIENFLSYWGKPDTALPIASKKHKDGKKGQKTVRDPVYEKYRVIWEMFCDAKSTYYIPYRDKLLIAKISLLIHLERKPDFFGEVCNVYKIPPENRQDKEVREWVESKEKYLIICTEMLEMFLSDIPVLIQKKPQCEKWFVDYFGTAIRRYIPDYEERYSVETKRKTDFQKGLKLFSRFLQGEHPKDLEYTRQTYRNFTEGVRPRGQIVLLHCAYTLLYSTVDTWEKEVAVLVNEIKANSANHDPLTTREAIKRIYLEEYPEFDYKTIMDDLSKEM